MLLNSQFIFTGNYNITYGTKKKTIPPVEKISLSNNLYNSDKYILINIHTLRNLMSADVLLFFEDGATIFVIYQL